MLLRLLLIIRLLLILVLTSIYFIFSIVQSIIPTVFVRTGIANVLVLIAKFSPPPPWLNILSLLFDSSYIADIFIYTKIFVCIFIFNRFDVKAVKFYVLLRVFD